MAKNNKAQAEDSATSPTYVTWGIDDIFNGEAKTLSQGAGRGRSSVHFKELRLTNGALEMDYIFSTGGAKLSGTMSLPYHREDDLGVLVTKLVEVCETNFHQLRRTRD